MKSLMLLLALTLSTSVFADRFGQGMNCGSRAMERWGYADFETNCRYQLNRAIRRGTYRQPVRSKFPSLPQTCKSRYAWECRAHEGNGGGSKSFHN